MLSTNATAQPSFRVSRRTSQNYMDGCNIAMPHPASCVLEIICWSSTRRPIRPITICPCPSGITQDVYTVLRLEITDVVSGYHWPEIICMAFLSTTRSVRFSGHPGTQSFLCFHQDCQEGIMLLGSPLWGSPDFMASQANQVIDKAIELQNKLLDLDDPYICCAVAWE